MLGGTRGSILGMVFLMVGGLSMPAYGAWVLGQGQTAKLKRLFSEPAVQKEASILLDEVEVTPSQVKLRFLGARGVDTVLWVTLVHPSAASDNAKVLKSCAIESTPGPIDEGALNHLVALISRAEPLLFWSE